MDAPRRGPPRSGCDHDRDHRGQGDADRHRAGCGGGQRTPTGQAVFGTANPTTGAITGQLVGTDDQGKKVTFAVTGKPTTGTLVYNSKTASFTYTPTTAQRVLAALTTTVDTIAMTVTASDGVNKVALQIDIPIGAIPLAVRTDVPVGGAGAAAATNTRAYVTNRNAGTVTVIDTVTGTIVGTFAAGSEPDGVAVKPDGTRLYVSSSTKNTVTVIDTATGVVKASIAVNAPTAITVSPTGAQCSSPMTSTALSRV